MHLVSIMCLSHDICNCASSISQANHLLSVNCQCFARLIVLHVTNTTLCPDSRHQHQERPDIREITPKWMLTNFQNPLSYFQNENQSHIPIFFFYGRCTQHAFQGTVAAISDMVCMKNSDAVWPNNNGVRRGHSAMHQSKLHS